jgi:hypothetical protein
VTSRPTCSIGRGVSNFKEFFTIAHSCVRAHFWQVSKSGGPDVGVWGGGIVQLVVGVAKVVPVPDEALHHEGIGGSGCIDHIFLTSALAGSEWSASRPAALPPGVPIG